jgi:hypothetical protein
MKRRVEFCLSDRTVFDQIVEEDAARRRELGLLARSGLLTDRVVIDSHVNHLFHS